MEYREIGHSGLKASALSLGAWAIGGGEWWGDNDDEVSIRSIRRALDFGVNLVDTAPVYGFGHSEEVVGRALAGCCDQALISTKCGLWWDDKEGSYHFSRDGHDVYKNTSARCIRAGMEQSLKRLQTDHIDVFITHWQSVPPFVTPIAETMGALMDLKKEGKLRAIGASNVTLEQVKEYMKYGQLDLIQQKYSMLDRAGEKELILFCEENGITFQCYSPMERGALTGKFQLGYEPPKGSSRETIQWLKPDRLPLVLELLDEIKPLCEKYSCSLPQLVIAWTAKRSRSFNVICGARTLPQVEDNFPAGALSLSDEDFRKIDEFSKAAIAKAGN